MIIGARDQSYSCERSVNQNSCVGGAQGCFLPAECLRTTVKRHRPYREVNLLGPGRCRAPRHSADSNSRRTDSDRVGMLELW